MEIYSVACCCCCCWVLRRFLTSQVISITFYIERKKCDKFCSEALISAWGSFPCLKPTIRDQRLYFASEGSHTQDFYALENPSTPARFGSVNRLHNLKRFPGKAEKKDKSCFDWGKERETRGKNERDMEGKEKGRKQ